MDISDKIQYYNMYMKQCKFARSFISIYTIKMTH